MTAIDHILAGFERELELERELGVKSVDIERELLVVEESRPATESRTLSAAKVPRMVASEVVPAASSESAGGRSVDFAFLHERRLSEGAIAIMAKIVTALGRTPETAPIVFTGELPKAKVYVALGSKAVELWFPGLKVAPMQWGRAKNGAEVLVVDSPETFVRFGTSPAVQEKKKRMWMALKPLKDRVFQ